jgi:hypothetical protein
MKHSCKIHGERFREDCRLPSLGVEDREQIGELLAVLFDGER